MQVIVVVIRDIVTVTVQPVQIPIRLFWKLYSVDMNYMVDVMKRYDMTRYDMMHTISNMNMT